MLAASTFLLLARAFRSILLPVKAVLLNLASVGATYGVIVLVWQHGHGSHAIWDLPATGAITNQATTPWPSSSPVEGPTAVTRARASGAQASGAGRLRDPPRSPAWGNLVTP